MQDIPPIEQLPKLSKKCKIAALFMTVLLLFLPFMLSLYFWYEYEEISIAIGIFLFLQIVSAIITAKMRTFAIPSDQQEITYSTYEVATWFLFKKFICY